MKQRHSMWQNFQHWFSTLTNAEISLYVIMLVTFIGGIAGIFVDIKFALASILALLIAMVWYQITTTGQIQNLLKAGKIMMIKHPNDIYVEGISILKSGQRQGGWEKVRIYAPVGLCDPSPLKNDWLNAVKSALESADIQNFSAVYALPQDKCSYDTYAKERLEIFEHTPRTEVHYLPPEDDERHPTAAQGLGAIIFENRDDERYKVIFAFIGQASDGPMPRSGFIIEDKSACNQVADWFDHQILKGKSWRYVLRGASPIGGNQVNFRTVLAQIERDYYNSQSNAA